MTNDRSRRVILLIDYDNLQICAGRDAPGTELDIQAVLEKAQTYGTVVVARAYAEWNMAGERLGVYKAGIEPIFAPVLRTESRGRVEGKSLCDTVMVVEGVDLLWTLQPEVLVLVTSDKDLIPLARVARQRGAWVVVIGSDLTAVQLVEMCNELVTYKQVLKDQGKTATVTDAPPPSRLRTDRGRTAAPPSRPIRQREALPPPPPPPLPAPVSYLPPLERVEQEELPPPPSDSLTPDEGGDLPLRRRRRRRGRTRAEDGALGASDEQGADYPSDGVANADIVSASEPLVLTADDAPSADGFAGSVSEPAGEPVADEPPARPVRRRRRVTPRADEAESPEPAAPIS